MSAKSSSAGCSPGHSMLARPFSDYEGLAQWVREQSYDISDDSLWRYSQLAQAGTYLHAILPWCRHAYWQIRPSLVEPTFQPLVSSNHHRLESLCHFQRFL